MSVGFNYLEILDDLGKKVSVAWVVMEFRLECVEERR